MKALVYTATRRVEVQELPDPQVKPNEALIGIRAVGVCGSDLDGFRGRSKRRIPPLVLGHEFSGEIVETGSEVKLQVGTAVAVYPLVTCGRCQFCQRNSHNICTNRKLFGLDFHGALAEYVSVPEQCLFPLSPVLTYVEGALTEPFANALHVIQRCSSVEGKTGLIYGAGSIGLLVYMAARYSGAQRLAVVDHNPHRLDMMRRLGADLIVQSEEQDPVQAVLDWSAGRGVDFSIDAVGDTVCRQHAVTCTASGGVIVLVGLIDEIGNIDCRSVIARELELKGSYAYTRDNFAQALSLIEQGILPTESFVSEASLHQGQQIFEELTSERPRKTKVVFKI